MLMISSDILCISVVIWFISSLIMLYILDIIVNRSVLMMMMMIMMILFLL